MPVGSNLELCFLGNNMARPLRIEYPNAHYHVTCRGNDRRNIFRDDDDRRAFLDRLRKSLDIYEVRLHCYVLMNNHFHLVAQTPRANLSEFMRHFNVAYTSFFNRRHRRTGHLYQGRFKAILVQPDAWLLGLSRHVHMNPVRTRQRKRKRRPGPGPATLAVPLEQPRRIRFRAAPGAVDTL